MTGGVKGTILIALSLLSPFLSVSISTLPSGLAGLGYEDPPLCYKLLLALCQALGRSDKACCVSLLPGLSDRPVGSSVGRHLGLSVGGSCWFFPIPKLDYIPFPESRMGLVISCAFG